MNRKVGAVLNAVLTLAAFTVIPLILPSYLPPDLMDALSQGGFDLTSFLNEVALIGVAMAAIALVKGLVDESSPIHLGVSIVSKVFWLVFTFTVLGLGNLAGLGVTTFSIEMEEGVNTVVFDLSLFAYLAVATVLLKIVHSILEFRDARSKAARTPEKAAQA